jgi:deazaflavin-dependent oxidoreductase (nitroreductase family)
VRQVASRAARSDLLFHALNAAHRLVLRVSGGRVGWRASGMLVVELTTTGRRTGEPRTVLLTSPVQEDGTIVLVASRWGDDQHPNWFLNLQAHPEVQVVAGGQPPVTMRARVATADERADLWPRAVAVHPGYDGYQAKTTREIPLVLLEPLPEAPA